MSVFKPTQLVSILWVRRGHHYNKHWGFGNRPRRRTWAFTVTSWGRPYFQLYRWPEHYYKKVS